MSHNFNSTSSVTMENKEYVPIDLSKNKRYATVEDDLRDCVSPEKMCIRDRYLLGRNAFKPGAELQVLRHALVVVKRHVLRQVAQVLARLQRIFNDVESRNRGGPGSGGQVAGQHA